MNKGDLLARARKHCFFTGIHDAGAELCKVNFPYGIASIHYVQEKLGIKPDATYISTPDMTITRNQTRWQSGFGYGGKVTWGDGDQDLVILNIKPNACGMLVGGLDSLPDAQSLIQALYKMESNDTYIDGIKVNWDFYKSNHFIDLFEVKQIVKTGKSLPKYAFVIHGSAGEFTGDNKTGFGLYIDKSQKLMNMAEKIETPFSTFYCLTGEAARSYYDKFQFIDSFAKKKREKAAKILFGDYELIANHTHQGMTHLNEIILGCHYGNDADALYPITLRGDLPAYLVKMVDNFSPDAIEVLGFEKRAVNLGLYERLRNANIIPHGSGYNLPDLLNVAKVVEIEKKRYFEVDLQNDRGKQIVSEVRELPYEYRGRNVVLRSLELGTIDIIAKLIPKFVLKI